MVSLLKSQVLVLSLNVCYLICLILHFSLILIVLTRKVVLFILLLKRIGFLYINHCLIVCLSAMTKYFVLVRFKDSERRVDFEKAFDSELSALQYFNMLVMLELDSLLSSFWYVSLSKGRKVLKSYTLLNY